MQISPVLNTTYYINVHHESRAMEVFIHLAGLVECCLRP